ncbi:MAG: OsmC family protein [Cytophagales bacterium]|nr:OsmC family protein [Cytophagales bacterium]MDW8384928.1 OsmC family protein [Flammeovirgaceae bacterium]
MMKIEISRLDDAFHFEAVNEEGRTVQVDASPEIGGKNQGVRPMQLLLVAIGTCSVFDMLVILKKQRQEVKDVKITVIGERAKGVVPSPFVKIKMHFRFWGNLEEEKVKRAVELGVEKYCSVREMLKHDAEISYTYEINP